MSKQIRHAHAVDPDLKRSASARLKRIEGQIRGVRRMVDEERYCADILVQISAVQESLRAVAQVLLRNHLQHCATDAIRSKDAVRREEMYDELTDLFFKHVR
ncbi:MAG TPA: metal-sensitive transcriptional regulator [Thermoanaerobaculia bacterium]|jgi:DNA-binding FrmR family transcriptional regulator